MPLTFPPVGKQVNCAMQAGKRTEITAKAKIIGAIFVSHSISRQQSFIPFLSPSYGMLRPSFAISVRFLEVSRSIDKKLDGYRNNFAKSIFHEATGTFEYLELPAQSSNSVPTLPRFP